MRLNVILNFETGEIYINIQVESIELIFLFDNSQAHFIISSSFSSAPDALSFLFNLLLQYGECSSPLIFI